MSTVAVLTSSYRSTKTIGAILAPHSSVGAQRHDGIAFRAARPRAFPPVATDCAASAKSQVPEDNLLIDVCMPLKHAAYVIAQEHVNNLCCVRHHQGIYETANIRCSIEPLGPRYIVLRAGYQRDMCHHEHRGLLSRLVQVGLEPRNLCVSNFTGPSTVWLHANRIEYHEVP